MNQLHMPTSKLALPLIVLIGIATAAIALTASAHEGRNVGDYNLVVGFLQEPAYEGHLNGVSLVVTDTSHDEMAPGDEMAMEDEAEEADTHDDHSHDNHSHDDHSHDDHDHAAEDSDSHSSEVDVMTHGALFISPGLGRDEAFEFEITEDFKGMDIPYHIHPGDLEGTISVSDEHSHHAAETVITVHLDELHPTVANANVGDTIVWANQAFHNTVIMSGPLSSMTTGMAEAMSATMSEADATHSSNRVSGLASSLQVEVTHVSTSVSKVMDLTELIYDPGHYVAEFVPTAPGDYRFRFFGSIEGTDIDETFDSGPGTFDTVIASDAIQFPVVLESNRELQNAAQGALQAAQELEGDLEAASSANTTSMVVGIVGIVFGAFATGLSLFAIQRARKRDE